LTIEIKIIEQTMLLKKSVEKGGGAINNNK